VICKWPRKKRNAMLACNVHGAVRAPGIHQYNFVRDALKGFQRASQIVLLVERDNAGGDQGVGRQVRFSRASIAQLRKS
jgi:hypothetical protein